MTAKGKTGDYGQQISARRKLAIGMVILTEGPITGTRMIAITRAEGVPVESSTYPNTLRQFGFLVQVPGKPIRWKLSPAGEAWVKAAMAEVPVEAPAGAAL